MTRLHTIRYISHSNNVPLKIAWLSKWISPRKTVTVTK